MTHYGVAVPAVLLLVSLSIPSAGQTTDETANDSGSLAPRQTPVQVSAPASPAGQKQLTPEELGDIMMARKDYREAALSYKKLVDANPRNAIYWNKLGIAVHQQEQLSSALKFYQQAVKVNPQYADAQNNIGTVWYQRKKFGKAIRAYQRAIKLRSDMAVLYSNLGYAYFGEKKYEQSIAAFRQALALDPQLFEHSPSRNGSVLQDRSVSDRGRFYFLLAKSFAEAGNFERSLIYLRKAKEGGFASWNEVKSDPSFSAMLKLSETQEILAPKETERPLP
jgi:tetratricopeptide (TPR) repeat protein